MKCGQAIFIKNVYGAVPVRFIAQCEGRFLQISNSLDDRNGCLLQDWRGVLRELVAMTVPRKLIEKTRRAEAVSDPGDYVSFELTYPLPAGELARLLGVPADQVRAELADMAVSIDEV